MRRSFLFGSTPCTASIICCAGKSPANGTEYPANAISRSQFPPTARHMPSIEVAQQLSDKASRVVIHIHAQASFVRFCLIIRQISNRCSRRYAFPKRQAASSTNWASHHSAAYSPYARSPDIVSAVSWKGGLPMTLMLLSGIMCLPPRTLRRVVFPAPFGPTRRHKLPRGRLHGNEESVNNAKSI